MSAKDIEMGMNRTGVGTSPIDAKATIEGATFGPITPGGLEGAIEERRLYASDPEPVGAVPLPTTLKGAAQGAVAVLSGHPLARLVDKLGERLAFERTGTRLYEALLVKLDAKGSWNGGPSRADLVRIHEQERAHADLIRSSMEAMGADPTAVTPGADVVGVQAQGLLQVIADPRTTTEQSLQAIFTAELTDNEGWKTLVDLALAFGKSEDAAAFRLAQEAEEVHVSAVRAWLAAASIGAPRAITEPSEAA